MVNCNGNLGMLLSNLDGCPCLYLLLLHPILHFLIRSIFSKLNSDHCLCSLKPSVLSWLCSCAHSSVFLSTAVFSLSALPERGQCFQLQWIRWWLLKCTPAALPSLWSTRLTPARYLCLCSLSTSKLHTLVHASHPSPTCLLP